jgi:putative ABC transport system permease protein
MSIGRPATRAVTRWSLRLFRREWRQQLLVLALLTTAVAAGVALATVAINGSSAAAEPFGGADARIMIGGDDPEAAARSVVAARDRYGSDDVTAHQTVTVPGTVDQLEVRDQDPEALYSRNILDLTAGRYPQVAGEVALTDDAADLLAAGLDDKVTIDGRQATVVGLVENSADLSDDFALVAPGTLATPDEITVLVDTSQARGSSEDIGFSMQMLGSDSNEAQIAVVVLAATTLGLALVGLLASAAFVVVAQRRQRQLGMLVALGATERHVRLVMLATGAITGAVAAVVGTVLGVAGWLVGAPAVESAANHRISRSDLPWPVIAGVVLLAMAAASLAAWWPARSVSRLPVMTALAGRPAAPRPVRRPLALAVVLVVAGAVAIALSDPLGEHIQGALFVAGLAAVVVGTVMVAPAAIRAGGRLAPHLPLGPRLALRDLARYQARAAAALGAITLGLAISIGIVAVAAAAVPEDGGLSSSELLIQDPRGDGDTPAPAPERTAEETAAFDQQAEAVVAALGSDVASAPLDVAVSTRPMPDGLPREAISIGVAQSERTTEGRGVPYVATPEVLALYGIDPESIEPGMELLTPRREPFILIDITAGRAGVETEAKVQHVDLPTWSSAPNALVTEDTLAARGWEAVRAGWIVESPTPLTDEQVTAARAAAADAGLAIASRETNDDLLALRKGATVAGGLLAVAIVAIAVGLIRGEARRDVRTLTATGAKARTRRALTSATAAGLAVPGVLLGLAGAYLALVASYHADLGRLVPVPLAQLLPLAVGTPLVAAGVGWLLAGREPRTFARQELE